MVLHARLTYVFNKMVRQMTILTEFAYFFEIKDILPKKNTQYFLSCSNLSTTKL